MTTVTFEDGFSVTISYNHTRGEIVAEAQAYDPKGQPIGRAVTAIGRTNGAAYQRALSAGRKVCVQHALGVEES